MNVNEADVAGALRQEPVELVKCETTDLEVPATSEIVLEGEISPTEEDWEGPFGEYTGYSANPRDKKPVYNAKAVTYRNNPILTASCMGTPVDESDIVQSISRSAQILAKLQENGIAVVAVNVAPECIGFLVIVSVRARVAQIPNLAHSAASCIWGSEEGANIPYVIVVDDDVDVYNLGQVLHAVATKCHPYRGISRVEFATGTPFMPFLSPHERSQRISSKVMFDCTWPLHWDPVTDVPTRTSFDTAYPKEIRDHVLKNWEGYGFDRLY
jgi:4-hydroxy-3-polyprenylbenzoate decarboxylase